MTSEVLFPAGFGFTAALTALGVHGTRGNYLTAAVMVAGVFFGSALWGPIQVTIVTLFKPKMEMVHLRWVNQIAGLFVMAFGAILAILTLMGIRI